MTGGPLWHTAITGLESHERWIDAIAATAGTEFVRADATRIVEALAPRATEPPAPAEGRA
jgi:hypothetical protein